MAHGDLGTAKKAKNDEFYTQFHDIEKEMNAYLEFNPNVFRDKIILLPCDDPEWSNFSKYFAQKFQEFGLKKLISTSYAPNSKPADISYEPTLFELESNNFDTSKTRANGKIFTLTRDMTGDGVVNVEDLEWTYLEGDGDFRSDEVTKLRNESDIVITNPPFSLFRQFLAWIEESNKNFVILGNINAVTSKEVFPLIMQNKLWLGPTISSGDREFRVPDSYPLMAANSRTDEDGHKYISVKGVRWFTNIDHGRRHSPMALMTKEENLKFNKKIQVTGYQEFDNYNALEIPRTEAIPSDYDGVMGVPITFLDKYNPEQFEILDANDFRKTHQKKKSYPLIKDADGSVNGVNKYVRILIRHKRTKTKD
jgi:hypothetical protein